MSFPRTNEGWDARVVPIQEEATGSSFRNLRGFHPGFDAEQVLTIRNSLRGDMFREPHQVVTHFEELAARPESLPGVASASATSFVPPLNAFRATSFRIPGDEVDTGNEPTATVRALLPGYFRTMGIPVLSGRALGEQDSRGRRPCGGHQRDPSAPLFRRPGPGGRHSRHRLVAAARSDGDSRRAPDRGRGRKRAHRRHRPDPASRHLLAPSTGAAPHHESRDACTSRSGVARAPSRSHGMEHARRNQRLWNRGLIRAHPKLRVDCGCVGPLAWRIRGASASLRRLPVSMPWSPTPLPNEPEKSASAWPSVPNATPWSERS